jgi:hypothetical protein
MDPLTASALSSFAQGAGSSIAGKPTSSDGRFSTPFDGSGWNVNFGSGSIDSNREQSGEAGSYLPYAVLAAVLLVAWRLTRKQK